MPNLQDDSAGRNYLALAPNIADVVPIQLRSLRRWTVWVSKGLGPGKKPAKKPLSLTNDDTTWRTFEDALRASDKRDGIGFQMLGISSLVGIDLDGVRDPETGALSAFTEKLLAALPDCYAEVTPSGKGIRIFAGRQDGLAVPEFLSKRGVECYVGRSARYLTITGLALEGRAKMWGDITPEALRLLAPFASESGAAQAVEIKLPVPTVERIENWNTLFDGRFPLGKMRKDWRDFLENGDVPGGRSERSFGISCSLLEASFTAEEVFLILISAPGPWEAALDKRDRDPGRARALIWADIGRALKVVRASTDEAEHKADSWTDLGLRTSLKGKRVTVEMSNMNAARILEHHEEWRARVALDITTGSILLDGTPLDDMRLFQLQERVSMYAGWDAFIGGRQWWTEVLRAVADKNPVNPRERELRTLTWDGTARLDTWFGEHVAYEDSPLNRMLGRKWLISLVARWIQPGSKVDTVLILQGVEGARKNTFFEVLAGDPTRVVPVGGFDREDKMLLARSWIAEMPEAALFRRSDRNRLKAFITEPHDTYRPPYAPNPVTVKRAFVFVSTSNSVDELFNADQDGLRRFWPVEVKKRIDYEWVAENRGQLLAEAVLAYDLEEPWWLDETPAELRERVENAVSTTVIDDALISLIHEHRGQGGMLLTEIVNEVAVKTGVRPHDTVVSHLLSKHGVRKRRKAHFRYWLHPSWANENDADVIPLTRRSAETTDTSDPQSGETSNGP